MCPTHSVNLRGTVPLPSMPLSQSQIGTHEGAKSGEIAPKQNKHSPSCLHGGFDTKEKQVDMAAQLEEAVLSTWHKCLQPTICG